jgi:hypothetical protein
MAYTIKGLPQLRSRFEAIKPNPTLMRNLALTAVAEQKRLVPRKTGNLGRSIGIGRVSATYAETKATANYAAFVEQGTRPHTIVPRTRKALRWPATGSATLAGGVKSGGSAIFAKRAQLRAGCLTVLQTVQAANPTLLVHIYDHHPPAFRTPCAFVENVITEPTITHGAQTRRMDIYAEVHLVNKYVSNDQTAEEQDTLVDLVVDGFSNNKRAASAQSLTEPISVSGHEETAVGPNGETLAYACSVISVIGRFIEGHS